LFWLLLAYMSNAIGFVPHTVFWVDYIARGLGRGVVTGNHYWILLGISAAAGPNVAGWLADKIGFANSIRISLAGLGAGALVYWGRLHGDGNHVAGGRAGGRTGSGQRPEANMGMDDDGVRDRPRRIRSEPRPLPLQP
jgi:hypothetical protein